jgi:two-component system chemotaxis response regulator CheB
MRPLRVLVVEDSLTVRERIVEVLSEDPCFKVVGQTGDGSAAIRLCDSERPDVISLDMVLPGMSGLEVTRHIMSTRATPILVVSASANRGEAFDTFDALQAGAVDIFEKSRMGKDAGWVDALKAALNLVSRIRVVTRPRPRSPADPGPHSSAKSWPTTNSQGASPSLVVLGASTGGPAAFARLLSELPGDFHLPMLITLHMAPMFAAPLAEWLGKHTPLPVRMASDGEPLPSPHPRAPVFLAPPDRHLVLDGGRLRLTSAAERHSCRPSVDVMFESVAFELGSRVIAGLLTGMGRDGASGLLALRRAGAFTFAQDESTCAVFGMPREAVNLGAAEWILPLDQIAASLIKISGAKPGRSST